MKVYPCGYAAHAALIPRLMQEHPRVLLIDTRFSPTSSFAQWRGEALAATYGERYRWVGQSLGNLNFKRGGPIRLADPATGLRQLRQWLQQGHDLLLLCGCAIYERCHRRTIVQALLADLPSVEVILPEDVASDSQYHCLSVRQPWTWLLTHPEAVAACGMPPKTIENRAWSTRYRGLLLLHASATLDAACFDRRSGRLLPEYWMARFGTAGARLAAVMPQHRSEYATGALVGMADLVEVVKTSDSPWFVGRYGLILARARTIPPVSYPGSWRLFAIPASDVPNWREEVRS